MIIQIFSFHDLIFFFANSYLHLYASIISTRQIKNILASNDLPIIQTHTDRNS